MCIRDSRTNPSHHFPRLLCLRTAHNSHLRASESTGGFRRARAADIARWPCAPRATARRGKCRVLSLGVLGRVGDRTHPGGRHQSEQRRAGVHAGHFHDQPQVGARSGTTFRCIPDPGTHLRSLPPTRPTIGMLNLTLKIPSSVSGSSRRSHRAKPRARSIWADFAVAGP